MQPIIMERVYNTSIKKVWQAITDNNQMKQWYFDIAEFNAEVGFEFQFTGEGKEGENTFTFVK